MKIKRRVFVRIISYCVAVMLILGGFILTERSKRIYLAEQIANSYNESLNEFISCLTEIDFSLQKQLYTTEPETLSALAADVYKNSATAKDCLSRLPISVESSSSVYKFLSQAGDFSLSVAKAATKDKVISENNHKQLKQLISYSDTVTDEFSTITDELSEADSFDNDINNLLSKIDEKTELSARIEDIEQTSTEYPTLIYDGPFSDHIAQAKPKLLTNEKTVSKESALSVAEKYLGETHLDYSTTEKSNTESYIFKGKNSVCAVTKKGGHCLYMNKSVDVKSSEIYEDYAVNTAKGYIEEMTGLSFEPSYYMIDENIMTVNLAYKLNDTICYCDLIKVGVSMQNGEVVSVEARGFVMNHHQRENKTPKYSQSQAARLISDNLTAQSCQKAIITDNAMNEKLCYEFKCKTADDGDVLVYINANTLTEENIFILLHTDGGTLTK